MAEPLSVGLHATRRAGELLGKQVLVTGCGPIGVLAIVAARRAGAAGIVATDLVPNALKHAAAAGAVTGAWLSVGVPLAVVLVLAAACLWRPSPLLVLVAVALLAGFFGSRALDGLADPPSGPVDGRVTLLEDPRPLGTHGTRVTVRHGHARLEARAYGAVAARLDDLLAGERVNLSGTARPAESDWHRWRHVAATLNVDAVGDRGDAAPLAAFTNRVRRLLDSGARSLPDDSRAMFAGMVYGDDRSQSPRLYDDFRAAGLGHPLGARFDVG